MEPRTLLAFPLHTRSGLIGIVQVRSSAGRVFTTEDLAFLDALAAHLTEAVERARRVAAELAGGNPVPTSPSPQDPAPHDAVVREGSLRVARAAFEARYIEAAVRHHGGNISRTARSLGLSRGVLRAKLQRYGLR
jgi:DNA-binding NtrC family response regulator